MDVEEAFVDEEDPLTATTNDFPLFDFENTVQRLGEQDQNVAESQAVLIYPGDSYFGTFLEKFLSEQVCKSRCHEQIAAEDDGNVNLADWKILGVVDSKSADLTPWLWALIKSAIQDAYLQEAVKCQVIIYEVSDVCPESLEQVRAICDALRAHVEKFNVPRIFILISSLHSWSDSETSGRTTPLTERDYRRRQSSKRYRNLHLLERYVVASGKMTGGKLKAYVIGCGAVYGFGENIFHDLFLRAWHLAKQLPIYGSGKNYMPTIYIQDLAKMVKQVITSPPQQRYLLAVDPVTCQQEDIVKAISCVVGSGGVKNISEDFINANENLTSFQADQCLVNLYFRSTYATENLKMELTAEEGIVKIVQKLCEEYRKTRNLFPKRLCLLHPIISGRLVLGRQISEAYGLTRFTKTDLIRTSLDLLENMLPSQEGIHKSEIEVEHKLRIDSNAILEELSGYFVKKKESDDINTVQVPGKTLTAGNATRTVPYLKKENPFNMSDEMFIRLARWRLLSNQCQNQGFLLDGFPKNLKQAEGLFGVSTDSELEKLENRMEPPGPSRLVNRVIVLEASDKFWQSQSEILMSQENYNALKSELLSYFDKNGIPYHVISTEDSDGPFLTSAIKTIMTVLGKPGKFDFSSEEQSILTKSLVDERFFVEKYESIKKHVDTEVNASLLSRKRKIDGKVTIVDNGALALVQELDIKLLVRNGSVFIWELRQDEEVYQDIFNYACRSRDLEYAYNLDIIGIFGVRSTNYKDFNMDPRTQNMQRLLLFHGTTKKNVVSTLTKGFQLPENNNQMYGVGIYFSDRLGGSSRFSHNNRTETGYIFLCETALGNVFTTRTPLNGVRSLSPPYDSVMVCGALIPDSSLAKKKDGCTWPVGETVNSQGNPAQKYNEYVIFNPEMIQSRYILKVKFTKK